MLSLGEELDDIRLRINALRQVVTLNKSVSHVGSFLKQVSVAAR